MSFDELQQIRELRKRVDVLEEQVKQLQILTRKPTLTLPVKEPKKV